MMSYAIGNVIYGIPVTKKIQEAVAKHESCDVSDLDESFFEDAFDMLYTQDDGLTGYCGFKIAKFDEGDDAQLVSDFVRPFKATPKQKYAACQKIKALPKHVREAAPKIGLYLIWSSS
jgi:hypothetical protein